MDIVRKKQASWMKRAWPAALALVVATSIYLFASASSFTERQISAETLLFGTVERGHLAINVRGPGLLVPKEVRWIAANVPGHAERVLVKPGAHVDAGDLLVELSNPALHQALEEARWELEALKSEAIAARVQLETDQLNQEAAVLNARLEFESAELKLEAQTRLFDQGQGVVSRLDYERSQLETEQYKQRWAIERKRLAKVAENLVAQSNAQQARDRKLQNAVAMAERQVADLQVRAPIDGVVQAVPLQPGQQVSIGSNIATVARQDQLIAELKVPELHIRDVAVGQRVVIDTRNNLIEGRVIRVAPSVENGSVQVDVEFDQTLPSDARPDLSVDGEILVAEFAQALFVRRPVFAQSQSRAQVFKRSADLGHIEKTRVKFGRGSTTEIQILEGLDVGDQIVVSDYADLESHSRIAIN